MNRERRYRAFRRGDDGELSARCDVTSGPDVLDRGVLVRIHDDVTLDSHEYAIKVRGGEVARTRIVPGHRLAMNPGDAVPGIAGIQTCVSRCSAQPALKRSCPSQIAAA